MIERHLFKEPQDPSLHLPQTYLDNCISLFQKRFSFVVEDKCLLAAAFLSPHGTKWLTIASRKALMFGDKPTVIGLVKDFFFFSHFRCFVSLFADFSRIFHIVFAVFRVFLDF